MSKGLETRSRILDVAQEAILAKGFEATSIEEIVAAVDITKGGFFYHFPDKNALARALIDRHIAVENAIFDELERRAWDLSDDPLQRLLIWLKLLADVLADMPHGHPGCIVATAAYQERLFDRGVRDLNRRAVLGWRTRFRGYLDQVATRYAPRDRTDLDALADMISGVIEGGIVIAKALGEPRATEQQVLLMRSYLKLLFTPAPQASPEAAGGRG